MVLSIWGRTLRMLQVRLGQYIANIRKNFDKHNVTKHYALKHNCVPSGITFVALEKYIPHWRGSNGKRNISRAETNWIFRLGYHIPGGLNVEWDINCFTNNS